MGYSKGYILVTDATYTVFKWKSVTLLLSYS